MSGARRCSKMAESVGAVAKQVEGMSVSGGKKHKKKAPSQSSDQPLEVGLGAASPYNQTYLHTLACIQATRSLLEFFHKLNESSSASIMAMWCSF